MSEQGISDAGIAVMCDIASLAGADITPNQQAELLRLVSGGFVAETPPADGNMSGYAITPKGQRFLDIRGVGVNEA